MKARQRKYMNDPAYRKSVQASARRYYDRARSDPVRIQIMRLTKRICTMRDTVLSYMERAERAEQKLLRLIEERRRLQSERKPLEKKRAA